MYPSVDKVHAGSFRVSVIHRTLTGSLKCVRDYPCVCVYTQGLHLQRVSTTFLTDSEKTLTVFCCAPACQCVRQTQSSEGTIVICHVGVRVCVRARMCRVCMCCVCVCVGVCVCVCVYVCARVYVCVCNVQRNVSVCVSRCVRACQCVRVTVTAGWSGGD